MKQIVCLWVFFNFCMHLPTKAQVTENFSDGDFSANPVWTPNLTTDWTVDNGQLRSNAATLNYNFYITTPNTLATEAQWEIKIDLQFNTSSANYVDVYLVSAQANLQSSANNGYFVRIGGTSDEVSLYKMTAGASVLLINGLDGRTNNANNTLKIKVVRNSTNLWNVYTDISGTGNGYESEGTVTDNSFSTSAFFGFRVQQSTVSFVNKHFFDDITIGVYVPDIIPPTLQSAEVINANELALTFSENINAITAQNVANYNVNNGLNTPTSATVNAKKANLIFAQNFVSTTPNTLLIKDVEDLSGNKIIAQQVEFAYIQSFSPQYNDLIITEIMADPLGSSQPTTPLPDAEYIEIYNRSDKILNLKDCKITHESSNKVITSNNFLLYPKSYLLLCDATKTANFQPINRIVGVSSFLSLTNGGERVTLKNAQDALLFTVRYTDTWYGSTAKADGGWSLEMKDVNNPCLENGNWSASVATRGGTPAAANSISQTLSDLTAPLLLRTETLDAQTIRLTFNEKMDLASLQNAAYTLDNGVLVQGITVQEPTFTRLMLTVSPSLQPQTVYNLVVQNAKDCNLNPITANTKMAFALPAIDTQRDILLNEILFNPKTGGVDFIELYNNSEKYINLKDWKIANIQDGITANQIPITTEVLVLAPKGYLVLTTNPLLTQAHYPRSEVRNFFEMSALPSYNDDEGTVILLNPNGIERERFFYKDDFHFALLDDEDGVSLERISPTLPTNVRDSWHSASERVGFATPGYLNSQAQSQAPQDSEIQVNPPIFTPDGDGQDDFTQIQYKFNKGGYVLTAVVYDKQGRKVKQLAENQLLGTEDGVIIWDGTTQSLGLAPQGYYLMVVRVFDTKGQEKIYRKPVAVGIRF